MNIKAVLLTLITTFISLVCYPQVAYIATDSTLSLGLNLIEGIRSNNAFYISVKKGGETIKYTPDQLQGYGLKDGTVFTSKEVLLPDGENKKLFLQNLSEGPISIYYLRYNHKNLYYYQNDTSDLLLLKKDKKHPDYFRQVLRANFCNYDDPEGAVKVVKLRKSSLRAFAEKMNDCSSKSLPFTKVGITAGYLKTNLISSSAFSRTMKWNYETQGSISVGGFLDLPFYSRDLSFHQEINFSKHSFSYNFFTLDEQNIEEDVLHELFSISTPILLRYTIYSSKIQPYFNAGFLFTYNKTITLYKYSSRVDGTTATISEVTIEGFPGKEHFFGFAGGLGLQYPINFKNFLFVEIRYSQSYTDISKRSHKNTLGIYLGMNF